MDDISRLHPPLWSIAENCCFEGGFLWEAELLPSLAPVVSAELVVEVPMDEGNKYFRSAWRRERSACLGGPRGGARALHCGAPPGPGARGGRRPAALGRTAGGKKAKSSVPSRGPRATFPTLWTA